MNVKGYMYLYIYMPMYGQSLTLMFEMKISFEDISLDCELIVIVRCKLVNGS